MVDILIKNGIIVTMDPQRRLIDNGAVAVEKGKIIDVGASDEIEKKYSAREVIDATNMLVLPGLINAHTHSGSLTRGIGDDMDLMEAHRKIFDRLDFSVSPKDVYIAALRSCVEYIRNGTTCIVDQYSYPEEVAKAVEAAGIRGVLSPFMIDTYTWANEEKPAFVQDTRKVIDDNVNFIKEWHGAAQGRIRSWFGPMHELAASKELFIRVVALAEQYNVGIHVHLAESNTEVQAIKKMYGKRSIEYAYDLGVLRPGTVVAHACWLSEHDITLLAKSGATAVHTPTSEMKLSDGIQPAPRLLEAGANVALGTDGSGACTPSGDLIREMRIVALLHKVNYPLDPEIMPAERVLEMATVNGAKAVMWDNEIGSIEKGKKADIILVDLKKPHLTPILRKPKFNVVSLLVYSAVGSDVDTMIVNGKIIMLHRKILTLNEAKIIEDAQVAAEELIERTGVVKDIVPWRWSI